MRVLPALQAPVRALNEGLEHMLQLPELDMFEITRGTAREGANMCVLAEDDAQVVSVRKRLEDVLQMSLVPLDRFIQKHRHFEELLGRDNDEFVKAFVDSAGPEGEVSLQQIEAKVAEIREARERIEAELPCEMQMGMYLVSVGFKGQLLAKHTCARPSRSQPSWSH